MFTFNKKIRNSFIFSKNKGLTLVELIVVISIFLIITSVAIFNYGGFNSTVSLQNLTDDIALSIRKAQGFAIGARGVGESFDNSYGIHFSVDKNPEGSLAGSNKSFLMFSVPTKDTKQYTYTSGSNSDVCGDENNKQCIELFSIMTIDEIKNIKTYGSDVNSFEQGSIDIVFTRPEPKAYFCYRATLLSACDSDISRVEITVSNGEGDQKLLKTKVISIQNTGQISIQ